MYFLGFRMSKDDLHISAAAEPLFCIGGALDASGELCESGLPFTNSVLMTLLVDVILVGIAFGVGQRLQLVPRGFQNIVELTIEFFYDFARGVDKKNVGKFFSLAATIFIFFLVGNVLALVPGFGSIGTCRPKVEAVVEGAAPEAHAAESTTLVNLAAFPGACDHKTSLLVPYMRAPAADLNVTFAIAIAAVFMVEFWGFQALGIGYLRKFFIFNEGPIMFFVGLLELFSEIMRVVAFAFRIFGNIFGGEVVLAVMSFLFAYLLPLPFYGLELFVAFIQAVIFAVLTVVFAALAVQGHGDHDDHAHAGNEAAAH
ncbi:F0F1 ATP synthase subunit A [Oscillochloris sp. ZM17-4]|nr:F0F1 ATP synthase subunit A [Oscillochloris sp. ZM17-4]